jgi:hypothetical protein
MDDMLDVTKNVTADVIHSLHGAIPFHAQKILWKQFWWIHSVEYIRWRSA